jgi:hypothetical protein
MPPASQALMLPLAGAAALHVLLMRISHAPDAFAAFGWRPDSVYTDADLNARLDEVFAVLRENLRNNNVAVRVMLHPSIGGAYRRVTWAMHIVFARLTDMNIQSAGETDTE